MGGCANEGDMRNAVVYVFCVDAVPFLAGPEVDDEARRRSERIIREHTVRDEAHRSARRALALVEVGWKEEEGGWVVVSSSCACWMEGRGGGGEVAFSRVLA